MDGKKLIDMKKIVNILCLIFFVAVFMQACTEEPIGQQPMDSVAPGEVVLETVRNVAGGAVVYYTLPADEDLLYVKAIYTLNDGKEREARASVYMDSIEIKGFGDTQSRQIQLIAVDRSKNESKSVPVTIQPLTPDVISIGETLILKEDFGGIHAYWDNPTRANISVAVLTKDKNDDYVPLEIFYSSMANGDAAVRGLDTIPIEVITYVQDRWGNKSETKNYTLTPIFETMFDREKHRRIRLDNDTPEFPGYGVDKIFDGNKNGDPCYSSPEGSGTWPHWLSFDLGIVGKISRVRIYQRTGGDNSWIFYVGNMREFEVWGCIDPPAQSGAWSSWTLLANCVSIKPSGLPQGTNTDEDIARARDGEDFIIPIDAPPVRYLRILCKRTWADGVNFQLGEIEVFGDNRY
jgi:hypothetical protein